MHHCAILRGRIRHAKDPAQVTVLHTKTELRSLNLGSEQNTFQYYLQVIRGASFHTPFTTVVTLYSNIISV